MGNIFKILSFTIGALFWIDCRFLAIFFMIATLSSFNEIKRNNKFDKTLDVIKLKKIPVNFRRNAIEFIVLIALSSFSSINITHSIISFLYFSIFVVLIIISWYFNKSSNVYNKNSFIWGFVLTAIFLSILYLAKVEFILPNSAAISAIFEHSLAISIIIFWLIIKQNIFSKYNKIAIILLYFSLIVITFHNFSETTKFAILLSPAIYLYFRIVSAKIAIRSVYFVTFLVTIIMPVCFIFMNIDHIFTKFPNMPLSFKHRLCIIKYSVDKIVESPISGNGFDAAILHNDTSKTCFVIPKDQLISHQTEHRVKNIDKMQGDEIIPYNADKHAHNFIIQLLFENGIFGIVVLISFVRNLTKEYMSFNYDKPQFALNIAIIFCIFCLYLFFYGLWDVWTLISIYTTLLMFRKSRGNLVGSKF